MRVFLMGFVAFTISLLSASTQAAEMFEPARAAVIHHDRRYVVGPQSCFLMPDAVVALDALGPYCSSPRSPYRVRLRSRYGHYSPYTYHVPYLGYYRPWGWSDVGLPWGWY